MHDFGGDEGAFDRNFTFAGTSWQDGYNSVMDSVARKHSSVDCIERRRNLLTR